MEWHKVTVETTTAAVSAVSEILTTAGATGVEVMDAADPTHVEARTPDEVFDWSTIPHRENGAAVTAYYAVTAAFSRQLAEIQRRVQALPAAGFTRAAAGAVHTAQIQDEDWSTNWRQYYRPVQVTRWLTVVPAWSEDLPDDDRVQVIRMDPGEAFGTGTHPTTQLSLQLLEILLRPGDDVIDVGTGAGILSIAAKLFGAGDVLATDVDDQALKVARRNIKLNPGASDIRLQPADLLTNVQGTADVIVANILTEVLLPLIPQLPAHLRPHGTVILAGIYRDKIETITKALTAAGMAVTLTLTNTEWYAVAAQRESR